MQVRFELSIDPQQLTHVEQELDRIKNGAARACAGALNKTLSHGRTLIKRKIQAELNLGQSDILDRIAVHRASARSLSGAVDVTRKPVPLINYRPTPTSDGVMVACRKTEPPRLIRGAFIATMPSGHRGVYRRRYEDRFGGGRSMEQLRRTGHDGHTYYTQLPIDQLFGPTVVGVLAGKPGIFDGIKNDLQKTLAKNLESQIHRFRDGQS